MLSTNNNKDFKNYCVLMHYCLLFLIIIFTHYELKVIQYKYCTKNIFVYYLMNNSNLCIFLDAYTKIIEKCISVQLDTIFNKLI